MKTAHEQIPLIPENHNEIFRQLRNYLAGRLVGITRDDALIREVVKCLYCKLALRTNRSGPDGEDDYLALSMRYRQAFTEIRNKFPSLFKPQDELLLDPVSLAYVDKVLDTVSLNDPAYDLFGDAYEVFIGSSARGQDGQFFTPQNAADLLVSMVDPRPGEKIIDPACGSGTFLSAAARHLIRKKAKMDEISEGIVGIDKDRYLTELAFSRLAMITMTPVKVHCADSLSFLEEDGKESPLKAQLGGFDVVLTNPPFGAKIVSAAPSVQSQFNLGYRWKYDPRIHKYVKLTALQTSVPPQVLFVERCLSLVRQGGRIGMVIPESLISGNNYKYVVEYIRSTAQINAVIGMPESLFKTSGKGGTHTKTCLLCMQKHSTKQPKAPSKIFMADAQWCGRDSRGHAIDRDELPMILKKYEMSLKGRVDAPNHLGYEVEDGQLRDSILAPRYYDPDVADELSLLASSHDMVTIAGLVDSGVLEITTGDEVGKLEYGGGIIPFIRTSDISNWEVKIDPKQYVSKDVYDRLASKQDVKEGDILFVRDGTYLVGTCAYVTKYDTNIVFQSHICKLRVKDKSKLSPYLLLALLSSPPVKRQIKAKRFTQDIIDSLGSRINELILPIPKDKPHQKRISEIVRRSIEERIEARELARKACLEVVSANNGNGT